jgi:thioredoxin reductase
LGIHRNDWTRLVKIVLQATNWYDPPTRQDTIRRITMPQEESVMPKMDTCRIAIVGAGPIGLEAALYARRLGLNATVYERGRFGEHMQRWGHVRLFSPFGMNSTSLGRAAIRADDPNFEFPSDGECITGREHVACYLDPLTHTTALADCLRIDTQVLHVGRRGLFKYDLPGDASRAKQPFRLLVRESKGRERADEADVVLDCTGTYSQHRWLGDGGIPAPGELAAEPYIAYGLDDVLGDRRNYYAGKTILVVGGGHSAATSVCNLARVAEEHTATWVIWLSRCTSTQPIKRIANDPLKERDRLAMKANTFATRPEGNVEYHNQSFVENIEHLGQDRGFRVTARCGGRSQTWDVDRIIGNVGSAPNTDLYSELQVHELAYPPASLQTGEPSFYVLGVKSYCRNSGFLIRDAFQQIREVFALITGNLGLDLYKK